ncbi:hypothetical protein RF11_11025 [Thelohanellus kitauei]|uniref:Uncharacterized protein n=1 Tax=Thelohanellus kitauei TaxID=669202 RepID=A0A0C2NI91_THEKT|nr:hypothetical protein RF11_12256 [Thelohanellus kitauei]KII73727.1 hypothetical protein RF11_11025 [Thelohanellus kitauei]
MSKTLQLNVKDEYCPTVLKINDTSSHNTRSVKIIIEASPFELHGVFTAPKYISTGFNDDLDCLSIKNQWVINFEIRYNLRVFSVDMRQRHPFSSLCLILLVAGITWKTDEDEDYEYHEAPPEMIPTYTTVYSV